jgi:hypothetical protein
MFSIKREWRPAALIAGAFLFFYFIPLGNDRFERAVFEALYLIREYAHEHVLSTIVPAFFIAGAITVFMTQRVIMNYLGADADKRVAYPVASVAGAVFSACSCTVLPLFAGIRRMGAGLGPACTFLYSGPAINIMAVILTARILGWRLGLARFIGAVVFGLVIGFVMAVIFPEERPADGVANEQPDTEDSLLANPGVLAVLSGLVLFSFLHFGGCCGSTWFSNTAWSGVVTTVLAGVFSVLLVWGFAIDWWKIVIAAVIVAITVWLSPAGSMLPYNAGLAAFIIITATQKGKAGEWFSSSWEFAKMILPLLFAGVLVSGFLFGRPGFEGVIPSQWVTAAVGGNTVSANVLASVLGAFMYFATLTEVPIIQGLMGSGMGEGPALALLLAGPAVSLPNLLVIRQVLGTKRTAVYVALVICFAALSGVIYGVLIR